MCVCCYGVTMYTDMTPLTGAELKAILSKQYAYISGESADGLGMVGGRFKVKGQIFVNWFAPTSWQTLIKIQYPLVCYFVMASPQRTSSYSSCSFILVLINNVY